MRIDVYHHSGSAPCRCHSCDCLATEIRAMHADLRDLMTRDEVPSEITEALGQVLGNVNDNFLTKE